MSQYPHGGQDPFAPPKKKGLSTGAIIGIVIGSVFILLVCGGLCTGMMLPAVGKARETARALKSSTQVSALVQGCIMYANDNKDYLPPVATWDSAISQYVPTSGVGSMTDSPQIEGTGNEMVYTPPPASQPGAMSRVTDAKMPSTWILIREDETKLSPRQMIVVGYLDGQVTMLRRADFEAQMARQKSGQ